MFVQGVQVQVGFDPEGQEYVAPRQPSPYLRTLFHYIKALNSMDYEGIMASFDERLVHTILPQVLKKPVLGYHNYGKYLQAILPMFTDFQVRLHEVIEENHKMTVQATATGTGTSGRPYFNEFILIIHFIPYDPQEMKKYGGARYLPEKKLPKMLKVKEFVDSESSLKWFKEERQWLKEQQGQTAASGQGQKQGQGVAISPVQTHFAHGSSRSSQGQGQGQRLSPMQGYYPRQGPQGMGFGPGSPNLPPSTATSAPQGQGNGYLRPGQGYASSSSYNPVHRDRYSGV